MKVLQLSNKEISILKIIREKGSSKAQEIYHQLPNCSDFISELRLIHALHRKDFVLQIRSGSESIYMLSEYGKDFISGIPETDY